MNPRSRLAAITPWIEALLACADPSRRPRILLDAVQALELAAAGAVWRKLRVSDASEPSWHPALERGAAAALPPASLVRATLAGEVSWPLANRGAVVVVNPRRSRVAVVLGEARADVEDSVSVVLGLLAVCESLETPDDGRDGFGRFDPAPPPPTGEEPGRPRAGG